MIGKIFHIMCGFINRILLAYIILVKHSVFMWCTIVIVKIVSVCYHFILHLVPNKPYTHGAEAKMSSRTRLEPWPTQYHDCWGIRSMPWPTQYHDCWGIRSMPWPTQYHDCWSHVDKIRQGIAFNSLAPRKFELNFRYLIFQIISAIDGWGIYELALRWM